jgi:hypothetical protein
MKMFDGTTRSVNDLLETRGTERVGSASNAGEPSAPEPSSLAPRQALPKPVLVHAAPVEGDNVVMFKDGRGGEPVAPGNEALPSSSIEAEEPESVGENKVQEEEEDEEAKQARLALLAKSASVTMPTFVPGSGAIHVPEEDRPAELPVIDPTPTSALDNEPIKGNTPDNRMAQGGDQQRVVTGGFSPLAGLGGALGTLGRGMSQPVVGATSAARSAIQSYRATSETRKSESAMINTAWESVRGALKEMDDNHTHIKRSMAGLPHDSLPQWYKANPSLRKAVDSNRQNEKIIHDRLAELVGAGRHSKVIRTKVQTDFKREIEKFVKKHEDSPDKDSIEKLKETLKSIVDAVMNIFSKVIKPRMR